MVVCAAAIHAALPPRAEVALAHRIRVRRLGSRGELVAAGQEVLDDASGVGLEVLGTERWAFPVAEDQVHAGGAAALNALDLAVVEEQLEDVGRLRGAAELRVVNLV